MCVSDFFNNIYCEPECKKLSTDQENRLCAEPSFNSSQSTSYIKLLEKYTQVKESGGNSYGQYARDEIQFLNWDNKPFRSLSMEFVEVNWLFVE
jgi:hypothetical protein